ncbi:MAG: histone deacetylase family protein [Sumerlaeia bacterium]
MLVINNPHYMHHLPVWEFRLGTETYRTRDITKRAEIIQSVLKEEGSFTFRDASEFPKERLAALHTYHDFIEQICAGIVKEDEEIYPDLFPGEGFEGERKIHPLWMGMYCTDAVTPLKKGTYRAAKGSADTAMTAAEILAKGEEKRVYALCRPSGHHAGPRVFGGYCYFNNAGMAAQLLSETFERVALLDIDFHHGNGTQELFYERGDIFTASMHCDPDVEYPYYTGYKKETGRGAGEGANLNLPLARSSDTHAYLRACDEFLSAMERYQPEALVIAGGWDTHEFDPIGAFKGGFPTESFRLVGERLGQIGCPTLVVQEGGYNLEVLGESALNFLLGFRSSHNR